MQVAAAATTLFCTALILHIIVWRMRMPRRQYAALLTILLGTLPAGLVVLRWVSAAFAVKWGFWSYLHISEFHIAMSLAYTAFYPGIETRSPALTVMKCVAGANEQGVAREEIFTYLTHLTTVESRLDAVVRDRMLLEDDGILRLTAKGRAWARAFDGWRRLCALPPGG